MVRYMKLLLSENNLAGFRVHGFHYGEGFQLIAQIADNSAADLEAGADKANTIRVRLYFRQNLIIHMVEASQ